MFGSLRKLGERASNVGRRALQAIGLTAAIGAAAYSPEAKARTPEAAVAETTRSDTSSTFANPRACTGPTNVTLDISDVASSNPSSAPVAEGGSRGIKLSKTHKGPIKDSLESKFGPLPTRGNPNLRTQNPTKAEAFYFSPPKSKVAAQVRTALEVSLPGVEIPTFNESTGFSASSEGDRMAENRGSEKNNPHSSKGKGGKDKSSQSGGAENTQNTAPAANNAELDKGVSDDDDVEIIADAGPIPPSIPSDPESTKDFLQATSNYPEAPCINLAAKAPENKGEQALEDEDFADFLEECLTEGTMSDEDEDAILDMTGELEDLDDDSSTTGDAFEEGESLGDNPSDEAAPKVLKAKNSIDEVIFDGSVIFGMIGLDNASEEEKAKILSVLADFKFDPEKTSDTTGLLSEIDVYLNEKLGEKPYLKLLGLILLIYILYKGIKYLVSRGRLPKELSNLNSHELNHRRNGFSNDGLLRVTPPHVATEDHDTQVELLTNEELIARIQLQVHERGMHPLRRIDMEAISKLSEVDQERAMRILINSLKPARELKEAKPEVKQNKINAQVDESKLFTLLEAIPEDIAHMILEAIEIHDEEGALGEGWCKATVDRIALLKAYKQLKMNEEADIEGLIRFGSGPAVVIRKDPKLEINKDIADVEIHVGKLLEFSKGLSHELQNMIIKAIQRYDERAKDLKEDWCRVLVDRTALAEVFDELVSEKKIEYSQLFRAFKEEQVGVLDEDIPEEDEEQVGEFDEDGCEILGDDDFEEVLDGEDLEELSREYLENANYLVSSNALQGLEELMSDDDLLKELEALNLKLIEVVERLDDALERGGDKNTGFNIQSVFFDEIKRLRLEIETLKVKLKLGEVFLVDSESPTPKMSPAVVCGGLKELEVLEVIDDENEELIALAPEELDMLFEPATRAKASPDLFAPLPEQITPIFESSEEGFRPIGRRIPPHIASPVAPITPTLPAPQSPYIKRSMLYDGGKEGAEEGAKDAPKEGAEEAAE